MHWKTYNGAVDRIQALERASWDRAALWLGRIETKIRTGRRIMQGSFW
jgi:hypothetical protein